MRPLRLGTARSRQPNAPAREHADPLRPLPPRAGAAGPFQTKTGACRRPAPLGSATCCFAQLRVEGSSELRGRDGGFTTRFLGTGC